MHTCILQESCVHHVSREHVNSVGITNCSQLVDVFVLIHRSWRKSSLEKITSTYVFHVQKKITRTS